MLRRRVVAALGGSAVAVAALHPPIASPAALRPGARDGKTIRVDRNVVMACSGDCGGMSDLNILRMEEGSVTVDFVTAKGFFQCYHRCISRRKAVKAVSAKGVGQLVEESVMDVEGIGPGVSPWWVEENAWELQGRAAVWRVVLAEVVTSAGGGGSQDIVLFEGRVTGRITPVEGTRPDPSSSTGSPRSGFASFNRPDDGTEGFESVFVPDGGDSAGVGLSLAQRMGPETDARQLAYAAYDSGTPSQRVPADSKQMRFLAAVDNQGGRLGGAVSDDPVEDALVRLRERVPSCG